MTRYSVQFSDSERQQIADTLAMLVAKFANAKVQIEQSTPSVDKLLPASAQAAASPMSMTRVRWARDRKGNELPNPEGCEKLSVDIWKVAQQSPRKEGAGPFLRVTWQSPAGQGYADANCFDSKLHPWLIAAQGKKTDLYVVRNGKYLNIVGIAA